MNDELCSPPEGSEQTLQNLYMQQESKKISLKFSWGIHK